MVSDERTSDLHIYRCKKRMPIDYSDVSLKDFVIGDCLRFLKHNLNLHVEEFVYSYAFSSQYPANGIRCSENMSLEKLDQWDEQNYE